MTLFIIDEVLLIKKWNGDKNDSMLSKYVEILQDVIANPENKKDILEEINTNF
jgi:hypothetical protein